VASWRERSATLSIAGGNFAAGGGRSVRGRPRADGEESAAPREASARRDSKVAMRRVALGGFGDGICEFAAGDEAFGLKLVLGAAKRKLREGLLVEQCGVGRGAR